MSNSYLLRVVLDSEDDVLRDICIPSELTLKHAHESIIKAFDLEAGEMASFFRSNQDWDQGEEIGLIDLGLSGETSELMHNVSIQDAFGEAGSRMLYVYDFLNLWTFYVEFLRPIEREKACEYPLVVQSIGQRPVEAPEKTPMPAGDVDDFEIDDSDISLEDLDADLDFGSDQ